LFTRLAMSVAKARVDSAVGAAALIRSERR
jgi:hypothetical protein